MKKCGVLLLLGIIFLVLVGVQGILMGLRGRCSCIETSHKKIPLRSLKYLKQFAPSVSCENTEIIATLKNGHQTCLNPDLAHVKKLVKNWEKQVSQKKKQKKGGKHPKNKKVKKDRKSPRPFGKKTTP
ncbi:C-X-C motif chemokine 9 [Echinops telfairi]|uniref:C-X-C motif chemokine n=1 Tax=Echinops telfairi TaxID=9371 RepID=A0ABM0ZQJ9_ECHTE|nr:C-X-C motif chemokine 9 [Echinops telfairi]